MIATLLDPTERLPGTTAVALKSSAGRGRPVARTGSRESSVRAVYPVPRVHRITELGRRQDDAAVSDPQPPTATASAVRAAIAAGHESNRLAAALAFFRSRAASRSIPVKTDRLRV